MDPFVLWIHPLMKHHCKNKILLFCLLTDLQALPHGNAYGLITEYMLSLIKCLYNHLRMQLMGRNYKTGVKQI